MHHAEREPRLKPARDHLLAQHGAEIGAPELLAHAQDEAGREAEALAETDRLARDHQLGAAQIIGDRAGRLRRARRTRA